MGLLMLNLTHQSLKYGSRFTVKGMNGQVHPQRLFLVLAGIANQGKGPACRYKRAKENHGVRGWMKKNWVEWAIENTLVAWGNGSRHIVHL